MAEHDVTFVDTLWKSLKAWAKEQAARNATPTLEQCAAEVKRLGDAIIGPSGSLRADAVTFFAAETLEMVGKFSADARPCNT